MRPYHILCFGGGGVRGIFQTHLMHLLSSRDGIVPSSQFDLVAGTSIGSFNAACAALDDRKINFSQVKTLMEDQVESIFPSSKSRMIWNSLFRRGPLFDSRRLSTLAEKLFRNTRVSDSSCNFLCTVSSLSGFNARSLSNFSGDQNNNLLYRDAVMASCAAPVYFSPHSIDEIDQNFIDGGVWANSPILAAILAANKWKGVPFQAMRVVSIGTGSIPTGTNFQSLLRLRAASLTTVGLINEIYNASQVDAANAAAAQLIGASNITIINPSLRSPISLHDARTALRDMPGYAEDEYQKSRDVFLELRAISKQRQGEYNQQHSLADSEMIYTSGLSRVIPKRRFYRKFRNEAGDIETYLRSASSSIQMVSINMVTGVHFEDVLRVFREKLEDSPSFTVRVSLVNPDYDDLMSVVSGAISNEYATSGSDLAKQVRATLSGLTGFRDSLSQSQAKRFDLRVHDTLPFASAIMLDAENEAGRIQLETKPYRSPLADSFAFELVDTGEDSLFRTLRAAYSRLIDDAKPVDSTKEQRK